MSRYRMRPEDDGYRIECWDGGGWKLHGWYGSLQCARDTLRSLRESARHEWIAAAPRNQH